MTTDIYNALFGILFVTLACLILSPILVWILPRGDNKTREI
jgi:hypothetical protein